MKIGDKVKTAATILYPEMRIFENKNGEIIDIFENAFHLYYVFIESNPAGYRHCAFAEEELELINE
jgi:hypothetical protein